MKSRSHGEAEKRSGAQSSAIERMADWVLAVRDRDFPQAAHTQAKLVLLDTIGCGFAALDDECARAVVATLADLGERPQCTVLGAQRR